MKRAIIVLLFACLAGGCAELDFKEGVKVDVRSSEMLPVAVKAQDKEGLAVDLQIDEGKTLPVRMDIQAGEGLPVEIKVSRAAMVIAGILAAAVLFIAGAACFAGAAVMRIAKTASQSAKTKKE